MKAIFLILFYLSSYLCFGQNENPLFIPSLIKNNNISLEINSSQKEFYPGFKTTTIGFNEYSYLGPTLIFKKGDIINIQVKNNISETTTVHWHGLHISPSNDGGPHTIINPNSSWNPSFKVMNNAATYWYHPHLHKMTAKHVTLGAAGFIIIEDEEEAKLELPRDYGKNDFPICIQSRGFDANKQFLINTDSDDKILCNGTINTYLEVNSTIVRFRLLNASTMRVFNIGFSENEIFYQIASDGGLLNKPMKLSRLILAPGERAEILINLSSMENKNIKLMSYASDLSNGIYGASNMSSMGGGMGNTNNTQYSNNSLNGNNFTILELRIKNPTNYGINKIPSTLITNNIFDSSKINRQRNLTFQSATMGPQAMTNGPFLINGATFNMNTINETIPLNNKEIWNIQNMTHIAHPFHIHDVQFNINQINGERPAENMRYNKDVVLVPAMGSVSFITKFEDFTDEQIPYMYHCHMLTHEDEGMMGQFIVANIPNDNGSNIDESLINLKQYIKLYPNPVTSMLSLEVENNEIQIEEISIFNMNGKRVYNGTIHSSTIQVDMQNLASGMYVLRMKIDNKNYSWKIQKK